MARTLFKDDPVETTYVDIPVDQIDTLIPDAAHIVTQPTGTFVDNVAQHGVIQPILLIKRHKGDKYDLAAGRRRIVAAKKSGLETVPARVWPAGYTKKYVLTLAENVNRRGNILAEYEALEALIGSGDTEEDIILKTGLTKKNVKSLLSLRNLEASIKAAFEGGIIKPKVALEAAKLGKSSQKKLAKILKDVGTLDLDDIRDVRKASKVSAVASLPDSLFGSEESDWKNYAYTSLLALKSQIDSQANAAFLGELDTLIQQAKDA